MGLGHDELELVRRHVGGRAVRLNTIVGGTGGAPFDSGARFTRHGRSCEGSTNGAWMRVEVVISTRLVFAINGPDAMLALHDRISRPQPPAIYVGVPGDADEVVRWLARDPHVALLEGLALKDEEHVLVARNRLIAQFRPAGAERHLALLDALIALATALPADDPEEDSASLPAGLSELEPLISNWAISDDEARSVRIAEADDDSLRSLVASVEPHIPEINALFEHDETSEAATATGWLAEAALEAGQELQRRHGL